QFLVRTFLVNGNPSREINRIADAECAGMIVIGSHGKTNLLHRLMGSISLGVIENATRPVLIVRRSEEQAEMRSPAFPKGDSRMPSRMRYQGRLILSPFRKISPFSETGLPETGRR